MWPWWTILFSFNTHPNPTFYSKIRFSIWSLTLTWPIPGIPTSLRFNLMMRLNSRCCFNPFPQSSTHTQHSTETIPIMISLKPATKSHHLSLKSRLQKKLSPKAKSQKICASTFVKKLSKLWRPDFMTQNFQALPQNMA